MRQNRVGLCTFRTEARCIENGNSALKDRRQMPLYHFSIRDGDRFEDNEGFDLPDDMSARRHAVGIIHELQKADEDSWRDFTMEVRRDGQLVWEIPFELC